LVIVGLVLQDIYKCQDRKQRLIYYLIIPAVILLDQVVKWAVTAHFAVGGAELNFIPGFMDIVYTENTGAAFSILEDQTVLLIVFTVLMIAALLVYIFVNRKSESSMTLVGLSLVAGGGLGNLIDRVRLGYVVDYLDFKPLSFPIFNIADVLVCTGCGLMLLHFALTELGARGGKTIDGSSE
jgi:signal peptidase II